ncbi:hypothetical protein [Mycobacterium nebraskense]|uniref:hypothetical protein n=1 Tax=Mycobacterium nebraskense TaxID=244292 RepID=UPI0023EF5A7B|nr:hypothetical protein [Mycobacterium nebraskense]MBI2692761.1 hypothetical protein [Mycobacterium nebraskense]
MLTTGVFSSGSNSRSIRWCRAVFLANGVLIGGHRIGSLPKMEQAMLRLLMERDPVPLVVLSWIVTRAWPQEAMQPRCDVSFPTQSGPQPF